MGVLLLFGAGVVSLAVHCEGDVGFVVAVVVIVLGYVYNG